MALDGPSCHIDVLHRRRGDIANVEESSLCLGSALIGAAPPTRSLALPSLPLALVGGVLVAGTACVGTSMPQAEEPASSFPRARDVARRRPKGIVLAGDGAGCTDDHWVDSPQKIPRSQG
eukprot:CAMPEP_0196133888 /NCGR_PEP_ID=MMETSP0910-20130528/2919_1 /TAXON_ID=49265 /ORGANISM="Thalassiosira rotula, Strain GSO102" /LENGTH=119 /DNA_ID=CAMNT_0041393651 /DNA_START=286 /DNA_END=646 /DNA_ORIENTATION=-